MDAQNIAQELHKSISKDVWNQGMAVYTLFQGVQTVHNFKADLQRVFQNKDWLNA